MPMRNRTLIIVLVVLAVFLLIAVATYYTNYPSYATNDTYTGENPDSYYRNSVYACRNSGNDLHSCCEKYYDINDLVKPACVGEWNLRNGQCSWSCSASGTQTNSTNQSSTTYP